MQSNYVYIVESPSAADIADSTTEGRALCESFNLSRTKHSYRLAVNKAEFLRAFSVENPDSIFNREFIRHGGGAPVVHLSMHGSDEGIQLTDYTMITWSELREILSPINDAIPNGLMVTFSTCGGAASIRMSMVSQPEENPFYATVGSFSSIPWHDALVGFIAFYHNWFKNKPVSECVEAMKAASGHNGFVIYSGAEQKQAFTHRINTQRIIAALSRPTVPTGGLTGLLSNPLPTPGTTQ